MQPVATRALQRAVLAAATNTARGVVARGARSSTTRARMAVAACARRTMSTLATAAHARAQAASSHRDSSMECLERSFGAMKLSTQAGEKSKPTAVSDAEKRKALVNGMFGHTCGICEKDDVEVFWPNSVSNGAHRICANQIQKPVKSLNKLIVTLFPYDKYGSGYGAQNTAHKVAMCAIRQACGSQTIMEYLQKEGETSLAKLFNTVGIDAVKQYKQKVDPTYKANSDAGRGAKLVAGAAVVALSLYLYQTRATTTKGEKNGGVKKGVMKAVILRELRKHEDIHSLLRNHLLNGSPETRLATQQALLEVIKEDSSAFTADELYTIVGFLQTFYHLHKAEPRLASNIELISRVIDELVKNNNEKLISRKFGGILRLTEEIIEISLNDTRLMKKIKDTIFGYLNREVITTPLTHDSHYSDIIHFLSECSRVRPELCEHMFHEMQLRLVAHFSHFESKLKPSLDTLEDLLSGAVRILHREGFDKNQEQAQVMLDTEKQLFSLVAESIMASNATKKFAYDTRFECLKFTSSSSNNFYHLFNILESFNKVGVEHQGLMKVAESMCCKLIEFDMLTELKPDQLKSLKATFEKARASEQFLQKFSGEVEKIEKWTPPAVEELYSQESLQVLSRQIAERITSYCGTVAIAAEADRLKGEFAATQAPHLGFYAAQKEMSAKSASSHITADDREKLTQALQAELITKLSNDIKKWSSGALRGCTFVMGETLVDYHAQGILAVAAKKADVKLTLLNLPSKLYVSINSQVGLTSKNMLVRIASSAGDSEIVLPIPEAKA